MNSDIRVTLDSTDCNSYVQQNPKGKIFHLPAWGDAITRATGLDNLYLVARDGDQISGILPLVYVRSILFGNYMVSQAFNDYGGLLTDSAETGKTLFNYAVKLADERKCEYIEFRNIEALPYQLHLRTDKVAMHLPISLETEQLWKNFRSEIRNRIRRAQKGGLTVTSGGLEFLDDFYHVWTTRMRQLGTPCYSIKLMRYIMESLPNNSRIFVVSLDEIVVGAGFTTCFNGWVDMQYVATLTDYNKLSPNNLLYWSVIKYYSLAGASWFDFGRSTVDGPTYEFKRRWGAKPVKLFYQYYVQPGRDFAPSLPSDPKYRKKVELWKKLPLWTTRLVGPYISRGLA